MTFEKKRVEEDPPPRSVLSTTEGRTFHDAFTTEINTKWKGLGFFSRKNIIARKINDRKVCLLAPLYLSLSLSVPRVSSPPHSLPLPSLSLRAESLHVAFSLCNCCNRLCLSSTLCPLASTLFYHLLVSPGPFAPPLVTFQRTPDPSDPRVPLLRLGGKAHSTRGSTNSQLRSFTSTWLPTLSSTLESRTIFLPVLQPTLRVLRPLYLRVFHLHSSPRPFFPPFSRVRPRRRRSSSVGFSRLSFGCWLFPRAFSLAPHHPLARVVFVAYNVRLDLATTTASSVLFLLFCFLNSIPIRTLLLDQLFISRFPRF